MVSEDLTRPGAGYASRLPQNSVLGQSVKLDQSDVRFYCDLIYFSCLAFQWLRISNPKLCNMAADRNLVCYKLFAFTK